MTTPPSFADRTIDAARERRRLGRDVLTAFAIKIVAILALALMFFGAGHRQSVDPAKIFAPVQSAARLMG
jgi:type VI protein secretion system component VasF